MKEFKSLEHLFRCSSLGQVMTGVSAFGLTENQTAEFAGLDDRYRGLGRALTEKQKTRHADLLQKRETKPSLSQTVKTYLEIEFKEAAFGRHKDIVTACMKKGTWMEEHSLSLYSEVCGFPFFKNTERRKNEWITGEPDNVHGGIVRDIKTSWDLFTFPMFEDKQKNKTYWWQLQGYMWLWGLEKAELAYCLVDAPEILINDEKRATSWKLKNLTDLTPEQEQIVDFNLTFQDIDARNRIKTYSVDFDPKAIEDLKVQIGLCRAYLETLKSQLV